MTKCFTYLRNLGKIFLTNLRNLNKIFYIFVKSWQNIFTNLRNLDKIFFTNLRSFWRVASDCYFHRLITYYQLLVPQIWEKKSCQNILPIWGVSSDCHFHKLITIHLLLLFNWHTFQHNLMIWAKKSWKLYFLNLL